MGEGATGGFWAEVTWSENFKGTLGCCVENRLEGSKGLRKMGGGQGDQLEGYCSNLGGGEMMIDEIRWKNKKGEKEIDSEYILFSAESFTEV